MLEKIGKFCQHVVNFLDFLVNIFVNTAAHDLLYPHRPLSWFTVLNIQTQNLASSLSVGNFFGNASKLVISFPFLNTRSKSHTPAFLASIVTCYVIVHAIVHLESSF